MHKIIIKNLVPFLLCIIAIFQINMVFTKDLTPWKGGGFGMFATIDRMENRPVHITFMSSGEVYIVNPKDLLANEDYYRVKSRPDKEILQRLASSILDQRWVYQRDANQIARYSYVQPYNDSGQYLPQDIIVADSVIVQIYRLKKNVQNSEVTLKSIYQLKKGK